MNSVYLAARFSCALKNQAFEDQFKIQLLEIIQCIREKGFVVHSAHVKEDFGKLRVSPEEFVARDLNDIRQSDFFIAFLDEYFSGGVFIELGWASLLQKPLLILVPDSNHLQTITPMINGLYTMTDCNIHKYNNIGDIIKQINGFIETSMMNHESTSI